MTTFFRVSLSAMLLLALLGQTPALAYAPRFTFPVNSTEDSVDVNLVDNICQAANGQCTLRAAVMQANASGGVDTVTFQLAGIYTLTIAPIVTDTLGLSGDLDIIEGVVINNASGGAVVIDGNDIDRVFEVAATGVVINDVTIRNGGSAGLFGIRVQPGANLTLNNVAVTDNNSAGIRSDAATVTLNRVTLLRNNGSGLMATGSSAVNINNSTISGNGLSGPQGGGVYVVDTGVLSLNNVTIANNTASEGGGLYRAGSANVLIQNSIIAGNTADTSGPDCSGTVFLMTFSLMQNTANCSINNSVSNLLGVNPLLGPLQDNGGLSLTHALAINSPALNAGDPSSCKDSQNNPFTIDQRGTTRPQPQGARCDMGAYEVPAVQFASANFSISEGAGMGVVTATIDGVSALTLTVPYTASNSTALAGSDYVTTTGTLTFSPNTLAVTFTVPVLEDPLDEADETVALTLGTPAGALLDTPFTATLTILDNDLPPEFYLIDEDFGVDEDAGPATITANLSAVSGLTVTVNYSTANGTALAGSDYVAASGTLTFSPGVTVATFNVPIINETFYEPDETLTLNLGNAVNALPGLPNGATLTIFNDDPPQVFLPIIGRNTFSCWAGPNEVEPNGSTAQANGPLCFDGRPYTGGDSTPLGTLDWDYYTLLWPQAGQFTVRLTGAALGPGLQVQMYYQTISSNTLVGFSASSPYQITCPPGDGDCTGAAGLYYILVYTPAGYNGSGYTLTVTTP